MQAAQHHPSSHQPTQRRSAAVAVAVPPAEAASAPLADEPMTRFGQFIAPRLRGDEGRARRREAPAEALAQKHIVAREVPVAAGRGNHHASLVTGPARSARARRGGSQATRSVARTRGRRRAARTSRSSRAPPAARPRAPRRRRSRPPRRASGRSRRRPPRRAPRRSSSPRTMRASARRAWPAAASPRRGARLTGAGPSRIAARSSIASTPSTVPRKNATKVRVSREKRGARAGEVQQQSAPGSRRPLRKHLCRTSRTDSPVGASGRARPATPVPCFWPEFGAFLAARRRRKAATSNPSSRVAVEPGAQ